ncbi:MAG: hypothetical protein J5939_04405 [Bacteroidales bacterium]|nr:hypothetical protein [Bacteroidales bacterium]
MQHIHSILAIGALTLLAASCSRDTAPEAVLSGNPEPVRLVVAVEGAGATKTTGVTSNDSTTEAKVNNLQVFVFNGENLDGYGSIDNSRTITVSCTAGRREIYAVVNAPSLTGVTSRSQLLGTVSGLAAEISNFQMSGSVTETLPQDKTITIPVDRLAARVVVKAVKNGLTAQALQALDFRLLSICLTNVAGDVDLGHSENYAVSKWYNRRGYQQANSLGNFNYDAVNERISSGGTYSTAHYFYSMPNRFDEASGGPWTPRRAKLVLKVQIGEAIYDYPILLPVLESNKSYEIELVTLTRPGNKDNGREPDADDDTDEEDIISAKDISFEISVNPWTVVTVTEGTTI